MKRHKVFFITSSPLLCASLFSSFRFLAESLFFWRVSAALVWCFRVRLGCCEILVVWVLGASGVHNCSSNGGGGSGSLRGARAYVCMCVSAWLKESLSCPAARRRAAVVAGLGCFTIKCKVTCIQLGGLVQIDPGMVHPSAYARLFVLFFFSLFLFCIFVCACAFCFAAEPARAG